MHLERSKATVFVYQNDIFVIGGLSSSQDERGPIA